MAANNQEFTGHIINGKDFSETFDVQPLELTLDPDESFEKSFQDVNDIEITDLGDCEESEVPPSLPCQSSKDLDFHSKNDGQGPYQQVGDMSLRRVSENLENRNVTNNVRLKSIYSETHD